MREAQAALAAVNVVHWVGERNVVARATTDLIALAVVGEDEVIAATGGEQVAPTVALEYVVATKRHQPVRAVVALDPVLAGAVVTRRDLVAPRAMGLN
jgi:hypothetical protein